MVKSYGILLAFIIQIESFHFQIFMCPFDRKPTITFANPANLELPQNVEGILCPRAFTSNGNTMLSQFWWQSLASFLTGTLCCFWHGIIFNLPTNVYSTVMFCWSGWSASLRVLLLTRALAYSSVGGRIQNDFQNS